MTTTTCDICGKTMDQNSYNMGSLPVIRFNLATKEPDLWCHTTRSNNLVLTGSGPEYTAEFIPSNFHVCEDCLFTAFYRGVQDEFIKRQSAKLKDKPNAGLEQAFDQVFAHAPGKVPS